MATIETPHNIYSPTINIYQDALDAKFVPVKTIRGIISRNRLQLDVRDTSGPNLFGYEFTIITDTNTIFAKTTSVNLPQEKNKIGGYPSFTIMFSPEVHRAVLEYQNP